MVAYPLRAIKPERVSTLYCRNIPSFSVSSEMMDDLSQLPLEEAFDQDFWKRVLKKGDHPVEAGSIARKFDCTEIIIG
jgi:hypothetical protein